jgi:hypothetical protein
VHASLPTDGASAKHCSLAVLACLAIPNGSLFAPCSFVLLSPAALGQLQQVRTPIAPALPSLNFGNAAGAHCTESHRRNHSTALHSICPRALLHIINIACDCGLRICNIAAFSQWSRAVALVLLPSAAVRQCHFSPWPG